MSSAPHVGEGGKECCLDGLDEGRERAAAMESDEKARMGQYPQCVQDDGLAQCRCSVSR